MGRCNNSNIDSDGSPLSYVTLPGNKRRCDREGIEA